MTEGGFFMKKDRKQAETAPALPPPGGGAGGVGRARAPGAAGGTAFSVAPAEAVDSRTAEHDSVEYRFWLADWLRAFWR